MFVQIALTGAMYYAWTVDGTNYSEALSSALLPNTNTRMMLRVTHDMDDGGGNNAVKFYTSTDRGASWVQLGNTVTVAGTATINVPADGVAAYELGAQQTSNPFIGKMYGVEIWQDGAPINPLNLETWRLMDAHATLGGSPTIDVLNASTPGADLAFQTSRLAVQLWPFDQSAFILNDSHNEITKVGSTAWTGVVGAYLAAAKPYVPAAAMAILTQNPRTAAATNNWYHRKRLQELRAWGPMNGYPVIDTEEAFLLSAGGVAALLEADGIHPNAAGIALQFGVIRDVFLQSQ